MACIGYPKISGKMCQERSEEVAKVIMSSYSVEALEKDLPVYIDILRCIPNLTPEHAAEVVRHMLDNGWYRLFWVDEGPYIKVAGYLYLEGDTRSRQRCCRRAFAVPTPDPVGWACLTLNPPGGAWASCQGHPREGRRGGSDSHAWRAGRPARPAIKAERGVWTG